jgi:antitoxin VapB
METAKLFINGGSQAVRLPKEFSFPGLEEVYIHKCGNKIILEPTKHSWKNLRKGIDMLPEDFDFKRTPPDYSSKEDLF